MHNLFRLAEARSDMESGKNVRYGAKIATKSLVGNVSTWFEGEMFEKW